MIATSMSTRAKLAWSFGGLAAMTLLLAATSLALLGEANDRFADYVRGIDARARMAAKVRTAVEQRAIAARNLVLVTDAKQLAAEKAAVTQAHADVQSRLGELARMIEQAADASQKARDLVAEMQQVEKAYGPVALAIVDLALNDRRDEAIARMNRDCLPLLAALAKVSGEFAEHTEARASRLTEDAAARYRTHRGYLLASCALALAGAVLAGALITRSLMRSLGAEPAELGQVARRVASGDLSPLPGAGDAPGASVLASLGAMQANLAAIVGQVRSASDSIAAGSAQIALGGSDLSQRTEEQASALEQTASTMNQLSATVRNNADNARQAKELAEGASGIAGQGGAVVDRVVQTMRGIHADSRRMTDIVSVIDGIAFQTNILALNAAVESARAGDQGRSFAVVAGEVRSLAQRSAASAREIRSLITSSVEQIEHGCSLVDQAGATMADIVGAISQVGDIVAAISAASAEQSAGVTQVGQAVALIDQATQQNATLVEESAGAADSLKLQAGKLVEAMAVFRLEGRGVAA